MPTPLVRDPPEDWLEQQRELRASAIFHDDADFLDGPLAPTELALNASVARVRTFEPLYPAHLRWIAGLDIGYDVTDASKAIAVIAVLSFPGMQLSHYHTAEIELTEPYVPSFLAFREASHLLALLESCPGPRPELLLVDGNGRLHEREAGLAVAIGVTTDLPTLAVAKTYQPMRSDVDDDRFTLKGMNALCGRTLRNRGDWLAIPDATGARALGAALLTSPHPSARKPVFVSSGHRLSLQTSLRLALACSTTARVPEPIRLADLHGRDLLRQRYARIGSLPTVG